MERDFVAGVLKVALGTVLASVVLWGMWWAWINYQAKQLIVAVETTTVNIQEQFHANQRRMMDQQARLQRERAQAARAAAVAAAQAERHVRELELRREAAWQAYWRPSKECLDTFSVECGNAHIRARRQFEAQYRP